MSFLKSKGVKLDTDENGTLGVAICKGKQCVEAKEWSNEREARSQFYDGKDISGLSNYNSRPLEAL